MRYVEKKKDDIDVVVVPIGGGGLLGGIGSVIKTLKPSVRVIGVVASGADAMKRSFASGKIERVESVRSIADGIVCRDVNAENFALLQQCV